MLVPGAYDGHVLRSAAGTESGDAGRHPALPATLWIPPHDRPVGPEQVSILPKTLPTMKFISMFRLFPNLKKVWRPVLLKCVVFPVTWSWMSGRQSEILVFQVLLRIVANLTQLPNLPTQPSILRLAEIGSEFTTFWRVLVKLSGVYCISRKLWNRPRRVMFLTHLLLPSRRFKTILRKINSHLKWDSSEIFH